MQTTIEAHQLSVRHAAHNVLNDLNFTAHPGEIIAVTGPAASGKSTLLATIAGDRVEITGTLIVNGHERSAPSHERHPRNDVSHLRQRPQLRSDLTVAANIEQAVRRCTTRTAAIHRRTLEMLASLNLRDVRDVLPHELCASHQQTTAIGIALAGLAPVILLDQPVVTLPQPLADAALAAIVETAKHGSTIVVATHDYVVLGYSHVIVDLSSSIELRTVKQQRLV